MSQVDPLDLVWPVTVKQFLLWHGIDEPVVDTMVQQQMMETMTLRRAISGSVPEDRKTSIHETVLRGMTGSDILKMVAGRDSQWPCIRDFCRAHQRQCLSPFASRQ